MNMHYADLILVLYTAGRKQGKLRHLIDIGRLLTLRPLNAYLRLGTKDRLTKCCDYKSGV